MNGLNLSKNKKILVHFILIIGVITTAIPFIWMILTSLKTLGETTQIPPKIFPSSPQWNNYKKAIDTLPYGTFYYNTIVYTIVTTIGQLVFCSMAGYAFARIDFPGKNFIFILILSVLMVPGQIFIIPQFMIIKKLGLLNSIPALILPGLFSAFGTYLMKQFFMNIPKELEEAAVLDGYNRFQILTKIMLPLVKPALTALAISTMLYCWNSLMWPLIANTSIDKMTLSAGLASMQGQHSTNYPVMMAGTVLAIWPMIIVFLIFQKQFVEGMAFTGTKG
ncbi:binding--dependent transport system inner membrane component family protein [Clostridium argentinense CDC 2741]|uniref:Binding--dependent transport system inner membrane component family protein n=1 Tax=Clostridium argentinense CDC 2741 TaxID=1418104 RepID=A0A0C1U5Z0_9CLOT|nr:carbohydrate ABC transporter permease [Clostridium argentinense]ARC85499.1 sugar ABC transporter permease [Clostridium argentinense]KIE47183.1 binding--dependent transport system inner membrane component family protein [Clostridium argentinense CDC 2741]NFF40011.1 carbohydrate ABC transporter permease [Clostridium argentinense]NFP50289.1 carbohydrate ABC transporter permease [Clostridium argentinense]NFP71930.1 carbohydrate ABC transporter permease [Clostridium argentinense]